MKKIKLPIYCLMLLSILLNVACYEPIANTSAVHKESQTTIDNSRNDSTTVENMGETNKVESPSNKGNNEKAATNNDSRAITATGFQGNLRQNLSKNGLSVSDIYDSSNSVESRIVKEYGAVFLTKAMPPSKVMFTSETEVSVFQSNAGSASANIGGANVQLQPMALKALENAVTDAKSKGLSITPRDKKDSAKRSYQQTLDLWNDRFTKACNHWKEKGRLTESQISKLKSLPIKEQVKEVLELEKKGIYFNTFFNNTILSSVAAPGTSQHLSMLAFDVKEFQSNKVRAVLAQHGWFRTVQNDEPHFTYLGYSEKELPRLGLKKSNKDGGFWIPNI